MSCLFCAIIKKEIPSEIVYEDIDLVVFKDINPKAPVHILIVPKKHIPTINDLAENDIELMGKLIYQAKIIAKEQGISESGYRLVFNCGRDAGQIVAHIHLHLLGGASLGGII